MKSFTQIASRAFGIAASTAVVLGGTSFAQCPADDATTTNNDCANAAAGTIGTTTGLSVQGGVEDFWSYTVAPGDQLAVDCNFIDANGDIDLEVFDDGTCSVFASNSAGIVDIESVTYDNNTAAPVTVVLRVFIFQNPAGTCNDYDLVATSMAIPPDPCLAGVDDGEEDNDTCLTAAAPSANPLLGLFVSNVDEDFYTYTLNADEILDIRLDYINANGDVDAQLIDTSDCATVLVDSNFSFSDFEDLTYTNATGAVQTVVLRVLIDNTTNITLNCNNYDLSSTITVDPCSLLPVDSEEPNDTCLTAVVPSANPAPMLNVSKTDEDWYSYTLNPGEILNATVLHLSLNGDIDLEIYAADCATVLAAAETGLDDETILWNNTTGAAATVALRVFVWAGDDVDCAPDYTLTSSVTIDPCLAAIDDALEDNDTCLTAGAGQLAAAGLFVSQADEDFYSYTLQNGEILDVDLAFLIANGDIDAQILDAADCATILDDQAGSFADNEALTYNNNTGAAQTVVLRVYVDATSTSACNTYDLAAAISVDPCFMAVDDMFEENDVCASASPVTAGLQSGLFVRKEFVDEDWYSTDVLDGATLTVTCSFINDDGDIDIDLFDACGGILLQGSAGTADTEDVTWTNGTGATVNVKWAVFVWDGDPTEDCNTYDMDVDIQGGMATNLIPYCFGDGSGTPCPCGNNSTAGHLGGCANSAGNGAILVATGNPTVGADTLNLDLSSASLNSFALLVSGVNQLPQVGGCIGCGNPAFDGLRCAGGGFLRHGSRALNGAGETGNGWGPPGGPAGGLIAANGFMVGQTRNFFAFYRDNDLLVCQTGQNSSNGISVTFN